MFLGNMVRSDRPESSTDFIFLYLGLITGGLWIYCNIIQKELIALSVMVTFLGSVKAVKIGSDFQKKRKAASDATDTPEAKTDTNP